MYRALLFAADLLYRYAYAIYRPLYFWYKRRSDASELQWMRQLIRPGDVVLDVGANIGFYSRYLSGLVGERGVVHAFEPDPLNYSRLLANVRDCPNVRAGNVAISSAKGVLKLYHSSLLNVDHRTYAHPDGGDPIEVPAESLDALLGDARVDFVKIDIQGYEMEAFRGMRGLLAANPGIVILAELFPSALADAGSSPAEMLDFFWDLGFGIHRLEGTALQAMTRLDLQRYEQAGTLDFDNILVRRRVQ